MGSVPAQPDGRRTPTILPSRAADEVQRRQRRLVCELFLRRGAFWDVIADMRRRWKVEPVTRVPPSFREYGFEPEEKRYTLFPIPAATDWTNEQRVRWHKDLEQILGVAFPEGHSSASSHRHFVLDCVLFEPPETELCEYAERRRPGATVLMHEGMEAGLAQEEVSAMPHMALPPITHVRDPDRAEAVTMLFYERLLAELDKRHLKPRGLDLQAMVDDVLRKTSVHKDYQDERLKVSLEPKTVIEVQPHTRLEDVKQAFRMIAATQPLRPKPGRPRLDELVALESAILHDRHNSKDPADGRRMRWTYQRLAERFGLPSISSARAYVEFGREFLEKN